MRIIGLSTEKRRSAWLDQRKDTAILQVNWLENRRAKICFESSCEHSVLASFYLLSASESKPGKEVEAKFEDLSRF